MINSWGEKNAHLTLKNQSLTHWYKIMTMMIVPYIQFKKFWN